MEEENLIGRYIKCLVDNPMGGIFIKKGDIGKIVSNSYVDFPHFKGYVYSLTCIKRDLGTKIELMPKDYNPNKPKEEPKYEYKVVHCTTQEEWDVVTKITNCCRKVKFKVSKDDYGVANCINFIDKCWGSLELYQNNNAKIYSFQEWSDKFISEKKIDMVEIQQEAKKRFPIGCTYRTANGCTYILKQDSTVYTIMNKSIYATSGLGCLYQDGKWAELISLPKSENTTITWEQLLQSDGCEVNYDIEASTGKGVITVEDGRVYICQNSRSGDSCKDKKGFKYSWKLDDYPDTESTYYLNFVKKIYPKQSTTWTPKVGDWVVIDNLVNYTDGGLLTGKIGHVFQIGKIEGSWIHTTDTTSILGKCWRKENLRLALPHEIPTTSKYTPTSHTPTTTQVDASSPKIQVRDTYKIDIVIPQRVPITLTNMDREVNIKLNKLKTVKI